MELCLSAVEVILNIIVIQIIAYATVALIGSLQLPLFACRTDIIVRYTMPFVLAICRKGAEVAKLAAITVNECIPEGSVGGSRFL